MTEPTEWIRVRGARSHNLQGVDVDLPRDRLVVVTGVSGSGKSSLAFDTLYAEGQRRYVESLSVYARQFLDQLEPPEVDHVEGLSPAIAIEQRTSGASPRSTVGTITEVYDFLRVLYARLGVAYSPYTGRPLQRQTAVDIVDRLLRLPERTRVAILAPVVRGKKGSQLETIDRLQKEGYTRLRIDGQDVVLPTDLALDRKKSHDVDVYVDRIAIRPDRRARLADSVELALRLGEGLIIVRHPDAGREDLISELRAEPETGFTVPELEPRLFSFNSPHGACPRCSGLGEVVEFDPERVIPDPDRSLADGAIAPWKDRMKAHRPLLEGLAKKYKARLDLPWKALTDSFQKKVLYGTGKASISIVFEGDGQDYRFAKPFEGVIPQLRRQFEESGADTVREGLRAFTQTVVCPDCQGARLRLEARCVQVSERPIHEVTRMSVDGALAWVEGVQAQPEYEAVAARLRRELTDRLRFLQSVGLGYLGLDRSAATLSGGESQRIRLATQLGRSLMGVLYVLDEPSIGLHPRDNQRLLASLIQLRDQRNTVIVVEHDEETIRAADWVVDMGPGAGERGGHVVASGPPSRIEADPNSLTGAYLSGRKRIEAPTSRRSPQGWMTLRNARGHNLKGIDVAFPLGCLITVTGVSGSGKSTLVNRTLKRILQRRLHGAKDVPAPHDALEGADGIDKLVAIDQSPIGRTPRSNPATYTQLFTDIRDLFAQLPDSKVRGYKPGRFSFNVKGGRCETCEGDGQVRVEMHFLADMYVACPACGGARYNRETLEVKYKGLSVADVLNLSVAQALPIFEHVPSMRRKLETLRKVGLGYVRLGQPGNTLSGGEAQRVKLAKELARVSTGKTLYILDEPTTGLHFEDVRVLLDVLQELVDQGNTVLLIEHATEVMRASDHLVDLGPGGGEGGGHLVCAGTPEAVAAERGSVTGQVLAAMGMGGPAAPARAKSVAKAKRAGEPANRGRKRAARS